MARRPKPPQFERTMFTTRNYYVLLRRDWIAAEAFERRWFLAMVCPEMTEESRERVIALTEDEDRWHWIYRLEDSKPEAPPEGDVAPLDALHCYWRKVDTEDRIRFLTEMLTPNERRTLQYGLEDVEASHGQ